VSDTFGASSKFRMLAVNDDWTCRENLCLMADTSISGARVDLEGCLEYCAMCLRLSETMQLFKLHSQRLQVRHGDAAELLRPGVQVVPTTNRVPFQRLQIPCLPLWHQSTVTARSLLLQAISTTRFSRCLEDHPKELGWCAQAHLQKPSDAN
jgi:hypothetical protein